jgi:hypothetical protein
MQANADDEGVTYEAFLTWWLTRKGSSSGFLRLSLMYSPLQSRHGGGSPAAPRQPPLPSLAADTQQAPEPDPSEVEAVPEPGRTPADDGGGGGGGGGGAAAAAAAAASAAAGVGATAAPVQTVGGAARPNGSEIGSFFSGVARG